MIIHVMRNGVVRALATALCFCLGTISPVMAQQDFSQPQPTSQPESAFGAPAKPKDVLTRAKAHTELAALYFESGNLIVALEELTLATSINPDYAPAFGMRGLVLYHINEFDSADKDFRRALSLNDRDPEINNNYGWYLCQTGKVRESIDYFEKAIRDPLYRTPEIAHLNAGSCHAKLGELDQAEAYIQRVLHFSPGNPQAQFHLADINYRRGNYDAARRQMTAVVRQTEPTAEMLWLLLRTERRLGDRAAEDSLAAQLRRQYPDSPELRSLMQGNYE